MHTLRGTHYTVVVGYNIKMPDKTGTGLTALAAAPLLTTSKGSSCEMGRGVIDFPALFDAIATIGYAGKCSIEFEKDQSDPLAGIAECVGYYNAVQDMM